MSIEYIPELESFRNFPRKIFNSGEIRRARKVRDRARGIVRDFPQQRRSERESFSKWRPFLENPSNPSKYGTITRRYVRIARDTIQRIMHMHDATHITHRTHCILASILGLRISYLSCQQNSYSPIRSSAEKKYVSFFYVLSMLRINLDDRSFRSFRPSIFSIQANTRSNSITFERHYSALLIGLYLDHSSIMFTPLNIGYTMYRISVYTFACIFTAASNDHRSNLTSRYVKPRFNRHAVKPFRTIGYGLKNYERHRCILHSQFTHTLSDMCFILFLLEK
jgi:hypothetical protein